MGELTDKIGGKAQEIKGKVTGSKSDQMKGKGKQVRGAVKGKIDDLKDDLKTSGHDHDRPVGDGYVPTRETSGI